MLVVVPPLRHKALLLAAGLVIADAVWLGAGLTHVWSHPLLGWLPLPVATLLAGHACWQVTRHRELDAETRRFWRHFTVACALFTAGIVANAVDAVGHGAPSQRLGPCRWGSICQFWGWCCGRCCGCRHGSAPAGHSSLSLLLDCPVDLLKVDKSFVSGAAADQAGALIVKNLIGFTSDFAIEAVAEGVETPEQAARLRALGYQYAQGYLYARPMPAADFEQHFTSPATATLTE